MAEFSRKEAAAYLDELADRLDGPDFHKVRAIVKMLRVRPLSRSVGGLSVEEREAVKVLRASLHPRDSALLKAIETVCAAMDRIAGDS